MNRQDIVDGISGLIARELSRQKHEEASPSFSSDRSDEVIQDAKRNVETLRRVRVELEELEL